MWRWNFEEFIRFFQRGLNPFKIRGRFKIYFVAEFLTSILREFEVGTKSKVVIYASKYLYTKFGEFWTSERSPFWILKFRWVKIIRNSEIVSEKPTSGMIWKAHYMGMLVKSLWWECLIHFL
jgi:hypothetical protein